MAPLTAREAPTPKANNTLGNLITQIIATSSGFIPVLRGILKILFPTIEIVSHILILELPMEVPIQSTNITNGIASNISSFFFRFLHIVLDKYPLPFVLIHLPRIDFHVMMHYCLLRIFYYP